MIRFPNAAIIAASSKTRLIFYYTDFIRRLCCLMHNSSFSIGLRLLQGNYLLEMGEHRSAREDIKLHIVESKMKEIMGGVGQLCTNVENKCIYVAEHF